MSESTIRLERVAGFTVLQNDLIRDPRLSLRTKGLFAVIASLPPSWNYSVRGLATMAGVGKNTVAAALNELEAAGYLERHQSKAEGGRFGGCEYVIRDVSPDSPPTVELPCPQNRDTASAPCPQKPCPENPYTDFGPQVNKEVVSKEISNTPYSPPSGDGVRRRKAPKSIPDWKPERFEGLWRFYPKQGRNDRVRAVREWDKLKLSDEMIDLIARRLSAQKQSDEWQRGIGIPYLCRYLANERWRDELSTLPETAQGWEADTEVL